MRQLLLLRHAKSSWDEPALNDFDRPLNGRGRRNARDMAEYLHANRVRPGLILCSAATRTRQTYDILAHRLAGVPVAFERGIYETSRHDLLNRLRKLDDALGSVLVIGHNPGLERLAEYLSAGLGDAQAQERLAEKYPTGTLAILDSDIGHWGELDEGTCRLSGFTRPSDLE